MPHLSELPAPECLLAVHCSPMLASRTWLQPALLYSAALLSQPRRNGHRPSSSRTVRIQGPQKPEPKAVLQMTQSAIFPQVTLRVVTGEAPMSKVLATSFSFKKSRTRPFSLLVGLGGALCHGLGSPESPGAGAGR